MILNRKSFSTIFAILLRLHHPTLSYDTDNNSSNNTGLESGSSSAPQTPIDFSTRRMPSTPLSLDKYSVDDLITHASSSEIAVDTSGDVNESSENSFMIGVDNDQEEEEDDEEEEEQEFVLPPSIQDKDENCEAWAFDGDCNGNPHFMLNNCRRSCLIDLNTPENYLLTWGLIGTRNPADDEDSCVDSYMIEMMERGGQDENEETCQDWANEGLCKSFDDKPFMLTQCARSCMVCIPPDMIQFDIGEPQEMTNETLIEETLNVMIATSNYLRYKVMDTSNKKFDSVRRECFNKDPYCSQIAAEGGCDPESDAYAYMVLNCAPTCQVCELVDSSVRCPIPDDAVEALARNGGESGLNAMFERIVGERELTKAQIDDGMEDLDYTTTTYSRPLEGDEDESTVVNDDGKERMIDGPWVITVDNFLTDEECDRLIELGKELGYEQSTEQQSNRDGTVSDALVSKRRTSKNIFCDVCNEDPLAQTAIQKIATVTGFPSDFSEDLQLLEYHPGQYYKRHHDYIPSHKNGPSGPRVITVLLYLNDVEEGGATRFNELTEGAEPIDIYPKRGSALIWPSSLDEDILESDLRTDHEALPVIKGMKYAANAWLHLRDEKNIEGIGCT